MGNFEMSKTFTVFLLLFFSAAISAEYVAIDQFGNIGADAIGKSGCSTRTSSEGVCWRYCNGDQGYWCYTASPCSLGCPYQNKCGNFSCIGADGFCTKACTRVNWIEPGGSLQSGCSSMHANGMCWRYCKNSKASPSGVRNYCITKIHCKFGMSWCTEDIACKGLPCKWASAPGCVEYCKDEEETEVKLLSGPAPTDSNFGKSFKMTVRMFKECSITYYHYSYLDGNFKKSRKDPHAWFYFILEKLKIQESPPMLCKIENEKRNTAQAQNFSIWLDVHRQIRKYSTCQVLLTSSGVISQILEEIPGVTQDAIESFSVIFKEKVEFLWLIWESQEKTLKNIPAEMFLKAFRISGIIAIISFREVSVLFCTLTCSRNGMEIEDDWKIKEIKSTWQKMNGDMQRAQIQTSDEVTYWWKYALKDEWNQYDYSQFCRLFVKAEQDAYIEPMVCSFLTATRKHNISVSYINNFEKEEIGTFDQNLPASHYKIVWKDKRFTIPSLTVTHRMAYVVIVKDYLDSLITQRILGMVRPFGWEIWVLLFIGIWIASVVLSYKNRDNLSESNLKTFVWLFFRPELTRVGFDLGILILGQGPSLTLLVNINKITLMGVWFAYALVTILTAQYYQAGIFSEMSYVPKPEIPQDLDELAESKLLVTTTLASVDEHHRCKIRTTVEIENCITAVYIPDVIKNVEEISEIANNYNNEGVKLRVLSLKAILKRTSLFYFTALFDKAAFGSKLEFVKKVITGNVSSASTVKNTSFLDQRPLTISNKFAYMELQQAVHGIAEGFRVFQKDWFVSKVREIPEMTKTFYATFPNTYFGDIFESSTRQVFESVLFERWDKFSLPDYQFHSADHFRREAKDFLGRDLNETRSQIKNRIINCAGLCKTSWKNYGMTEESFSFIPNEVLYFIFLFWVVCLAASVLFFLFELTIRRGCCGKASKLKKKSWCQRNEKEFVSPVKISVVSLSAQSQRRIRDGFRDKME